MPQNLTNEESILIQVMAWWHQARSMLPYGVTRSQWVNSLGPSETKWRQRTGSTLAQVMACCLPAPSHYLNQRWLIMNLMLWHPPESNFIGISQNINSINEFQNYNFKIVTASPRGQRVNTLRPNQTLLARCRRHHLAIRSPICILIQTNLNLTDNRTPFQYKDHFSWYGCLLFKQAANHCPQRTTKIMPL